MSRNVNVRVTGQTVGTGTLRAYPDGAADVRYEVPLYKVIVEGTSSTNKQAKYEFKAYRFGIQLDASKDVAKPRVVGLAEKQTHTLSWSYITTMKQMAWRVYQGFFIHKGPDNPATSSMGSIGCVEITGVGEWDRFNRVILELAGTRSPESLKTLKANYDPAVRPPLKLKK